MLNYWFLEICAYFKDHREVNLWKSIIKFVLQTKLFLLRFGDIWHLVWYNILCEKSCLETKTKATKYKNKFNIVKFSSVKTLLSNFGKYTYDYGYSAKYLFVRKKTLKTNLKMGINSQYSILNSLNYFKAKLYLLKNSYVIPYFVKNNFVVQ